MHDDLVRREFTAPAPNLLWLADMTEHLTGEGKLYLCAVKEACSNRIAGYSIDGRMISQLAVNALCNAVALRGPAQAIVHSTGAAGQPFRSHVYVRRPARRRAARQELPTPAVLPDELGFLPGRQRAWLRQSQPDDISTPRRMARSLRRW